VLGWSSGKVAAGQPDDEVVGDRADVCVGGDLVFASCAVAQDDLVAAFVADRHGGEPGGVVLVGWMTMNVLSASSSSLMRSNRASSDGSSMWCPFSLSAQ
jgi:hypothetical protein